MRKKTNVGKSREVFEIEREEVADEEWQENGRTENNKGVDRRGEEVGNTRLCRERKIRAGGSMEKERERRWRTANQTDKDDENKESTGETFRRKPERKNARKKDKVNSS